MYTPWNVSLVQLEGQTLARLKNSISQLYFFRNLTQNMTELRGFQAILSIQQLNEVAKFKNKFPGYFAIDIAIFETFYPP